MELEGHVYLESGLPAAAVTLRFYERAFGCKATPIGQVTTGGDGAYAFEHAPRTTPTGLEVRTPAARDEQEVTLTKPDLLVGEREVLNLVVPAWARPLAPEFERLRADLSGHLNGSRLGTAREDGECRDLTLLQRTTGWDARVVALASSADRLSGATKLEPELLYGALRAGLPGDAMQLARVSGKGFGQALRKAREAGVVALDDEQVARAERAFEQFARTARRSLVGPGGLSSYGEMLGATGLPDGAQDEFERIFAEHRGSAQQLWKKATDAKLPVDVLKLTVRLGYLTLNNAALIVSLRDDLADAESLGESLVGAGLYRMDAWAERLKSLAGGGDEALAALIPPAYPGATVEGRLEAYTDELARKVRTSYPTQVVAQMVRSDELTLGSDHAAAKEDVGTVLGRASARGFSLGRTPVGAFFRDPGNAEALFEGIPAEQAAAATEHVKTLQRLWQITPTDEGLVTMLEAGFTSAQDVTAMSRDKFVTRYGDKLTSRPHAVAIYEKAQQVTTVVYTFLGAAKELDTSPSVPVLSPPPAALEEAKSNLVKHFPTLESLFGSLDYCECDHCRSVLSPAAYLVDLLRFLDPDPLVWEGDIEEWPSVHDGAPYPFPDQDAWQAFQDQWPPGEVPDTTLTPYDVLRERRPDLPELPLTCENTHTAMPYIDVVNEILEYYLVHGELDAEAGHDTGDASSVDLLAEPQHIHPEAYDTLRQARYPLALPFDLWLETVRRFCQHFDTPLWRLLDALRSTEELLPPAGVAYGRVAVFLERLGISAAEHAIFANPDPESDWHELYGYDGAAEALTALTSAKTLARRLGVTYRELVELLRGAFVNPRLGTMASLRKLGVGTEDVLRYKEQPGFAPFSDAQREAFELKLGADGVVWLAQAWDAGDFERILVLADPSAACGFDTTTLRYADGSPVDAIALITINYLVRLRRRLGWSIAETDRALQVFLPPNPDPRTPANLGPAMATALLGLAHLDALNAALKGGRKGRRELLNLWAPLDDARYAELFLAGKPQSPDAKLLDHPLGEYLSHLEGGVYEPFQWDPAQPEDVATGNVPLHTHLGAVQAALQLTADEVARILADAGTSIDAAPLNLPTVSLLYRYGLLAKLLKLSVADLIVLKGMSGVDPFTPLHDGPVTSLADDHPHSQTERFAEAAAAVRDSRLSVGELAYLLRHRFDPVGPHRLAAEAPLALMRALAREITRIRAEHVAPADALTFTDDIIRQKLALVLAPDVVETFMGMWTGTVESRAVRPDVAEADQLDPVLFAAEPGIVLTYVPVSQEQRILYRGVLTDARRAELEAEFPQALFAELLDAVQQQQRDFFARHVEMAVVGAEPTGFLEPADFDLVFSADPAALGEPEQRARRAKLAETFLPYLRDRLTRRLVVETAAADLAADPALVEALVADPALLDDPDQAGRPLLDVYAASGDAGVSVTSGPGSLQLDGYVEVTTPGAYRFFAVCELQGTRVELRFDHLADPLIRATAAADGDELYEYTELRAGVPYGFTFDASDLGGGDVTLLVQGEELSKGSLDRLTLYPREAVAAVHRAHLLLEKTLLLAGELGLTESELRHLLTHAGDFGGLDLGELPTRTADDTPARATMLFAQFLRLVDYVRLRRLLAAEPEDLVELFAHARRSYPPDADQAAATGEVLDDLGARLAEITRRDPATVRGAAQLLGMSAQATPAGDRLDVVAPDFAQERGIRRLWEVLAMAARLGVAPDALGRWATPTPDAEVASDLRDTVKARYDAERWRRVVQPIADALRQRRRDALVAHIMHTDDLDRVEQLYERFLVDPGMEPVVQTSRLRLAISSVQLFIQRCLLNLEPKVHPSAIDSAHWQWMKRYRVWEANRKIFLWPENWLEPEWRDDKSHLFSTLESALLQSDLSNDSAETAFFGYLRGLEELARLDIRAIYVEERPDPAANILHVVGRTFRKPHKYFYRTYAHQMWTPWVPVTADIQGDHLTVILWRGRLHLFWVTFLEQAESKVETDKKPNELMDTKLSTFQPGRWIEAQLSWSEHFQGEWTEPASTGFVSVRNPAPAGFSAGEEFIHATIDDEGAARVHVTGAVDRAFRVVSKNAPAKTRSASSAESPPFVYATKDGPGRYTVDDEEFSVSYVETITTKNGKTTSSCPKIHTILREGGECTLVKDGDPLRSVPEDIAPLVSPFFYAKGVHTFYVEPALTETTTVEEADVLLQPDLVLLPEFDDPLYWEEVDVKPLVPGDPGPIQIEAPFAKYAFDKPQDWATRTGVLVRFGETLVGPAGGIASTLGEIDIDIEGVGP